MTLDHQQPVNQAVRACALNASSATIRATGADELIGNCPGGDPLNVADRLDEFARTMPQATAIAEPTRRVRNGQRVYRTITFADLARDVSDIATGISAWGVPPGTRLALLAPPGINFITLVFALLKSGMVQILIDPGMGRRNLLGCLAEAEPEGFVAIPRVQAIRSCLRGRFPLAKWNVTVGRRIWPGMLSVNNLRKLGLQQTCKSPSTTSDDPAAIIFTSGGTGAPKGVLYRHGNFDRQVTEIRDMYGIQPGEIDLPCFPLFGLFNAAMGVTTVLPRMNFSRPAAINPANIVEAVQQWRVTQSFASPAVWNRVGPFCGERDTRLPSLRRVLSAGAPVHARVLAPIKAISAPHGEMHVSFGATEALPVATIDASEVLADTWKETERGGGICVGRRFPGIEWRVIRVVDGPIHSIAEAEELPTGEIGELIVRGPVVTTEYVTLREANALAKVPDIGGSSFWHRMGDCGYLDREQRFWFCGRVAHRVLSAWGPMYTITCEAIFNRHPAVFRAALVGVGKLGVQVPVIIVELKPDARPRRRDRHRLIGELRELAKAHSLTAMIDHFLIHPAMPVDIRHNAKIARERLALWAARRLRRSSLNSEP
jgi:acyl-CoA synthetase (AMP-forming)/AMP-acid ligase II